MYLNTQVCISKST